MDRSTTLPGETKAVFRGPDRAEKGSALSMIAAESRATNEKTARLRLLRLAQEAKDAEAVAAAEEQKAPVRRRRRKANPA